jgi:hypothetical protein
VSEYVVRHGRRIAVEVLPSAAVKPKRTRRSQFVQVPLAWVERLQTARCIGSYRLALHLLFQHWRSGGKPVKLSNLALAELGVRDPKSKRRALSELEQLGLVGVERHPKKSPVVTVLLV